MLLNLGNEIQSNIPTSPMLIKTEQEDPNLAVYEFNPSFVDNNGDISDTFRSLNLDPRGFLGSIQSEFPHNFVQSDQTSLEFLKYVLESRNGNGGQLMASEGSFYLSPFSFYSDSSVLTLHALQNAAYASFDPNNRISSVLDSDMPYMLILTLQPYFAGIKDYSFKGLDLSAEENDILRDIVNPIERGYKLTEILVGKFIDSTYNKRAFLESLRNPNFNF